jgi:hypothetical protein
MNYLMTLLGQGWVLSSEVSKSHTAATVPKLVFSSRKFPFALQTDVEEDMTL